MAIYLDPKADLTFKKVFGEHKELMISFLNAMLPTMDRWSGLNTLNRSSFPTTR